MTQKVIYFVAHKYLSFNFIILVFLLNTVAEYVDQNIWTFVPVFSLSKQMDLSPAESLFVRQRTAVLSDKTTP